MHEVGKPRYIALCPSDMMANSDCESLSIEYNVKTLTRLRKIGELCKNLSNFGNGWKDEDEKILNILIGVSTHE